MSLEIGSSIKQAVQEALIYALENKCDVSFEANGDDYLVEYEKISVPDNYIHRATRGAD